MIVLKRSRDKNVDLQEHNLRAPRPIITRHVAEMENKPQAVRNNEKLIYATSLGIIKMLLQQQ